MAAIERILERLSGVLLVLGAAFILLMTFHVTADVLLKVAANRPIAGTLELVTYIYMVACIFLPLPHVQASGALIVVELFTQKLPARHVSRLDAIGAFLTFVYLGMIAWWGGMLAVNKTEIGETADATYFELPIWPMRWVLVVCCGIAALIALLQAFKRPPLSAQPRPDSLERRLGELEI